MYDNKSINSVCICKNGFYATENEIVSLYPCGHLIHAKCINKYTSHCPNCKLKIENVVKINDYKNDPKYLQQCVDILSVTKIKKNFLNVKLTNCVPNIFEIFNLFYKFKNVTSCQEYENILENIFSAMNFTIKLKGFEKIKNSEKKIFIANHSSIFDSCVIYYFLKCGFLASIKNKKGADFLNVKVPTLYITRGSSKNTVILIKKFLDKYNSICVFPEGSYSSHNTLLKFRTGAFKVGVPVYPVVIKYKNPEATFTRVDNMLDLLKFLSLKNLNINISILDPVYPPFDENKIEMIRKNMAKHGKFLLSRVMVNDVYD